MLCTIPVLSHKFCDSDIMNISFVNLKLVSAHKTIYIYVQFQNELEDKWCQKRLQARENK